MHIKYCVYSCLIVAFCSIALSASVEPIWLSPTDFFLNTEEGLTEQYIVEKGVWANLTRGAGSRANTPLVAMDSKGTLWIMFGSQYYITTLQDPGYAKNVWNYDPKTDFYRYVWGNSDTATSETRNAGELQVPAESNHPGYVLYGGVTIDKNDNLWFMSYVMAGELWMFNTTSSLFTRMNGFENGPYNVGTPGQPGADVTPGYINGYCIVTDSDNNLWLLAGYNNDDNYVSGVWHFNTTSLYWTFAGGSPEPLDTNTTHFGGAWSPACTIDENDKVWLYGGYSGNIDLPMLYSFDTRGDRQYKVEHTNEALDYMSVLVSTDYDVDNHPGGCEGCILVDRMDGTLMLLAGGSYTNESDSWGPTNQVWQYSKSLKQWRLAYGDITKQNMETAFTNYRQAGTVMPTTVYPGFFNGINSNGDMYLVGGASTSLIGATPGRKDLWIIPNDQCSIPSLNKCDPNADCIEEMIGYSCECKQGYTGDGFTCDAIPVAVPVAAPVAEGPVATPVNTPVSTNTPSKKTSSASVVGTSLGLILAVVIV